MPDFPPWDERYRETPVEQLPWYLPTLDANLAKALDELGITRGRALDLGTGPGTQALELAARGFNVVATDLSPAAVEGAARRAAARKLHVCFIQDDITASALQGPFDLIFDRGCFHVLPTEARPGYARTVARLLAPGGTLFLECFSDQQPGTQGPHRLSPDDIRATSEGALEVVSIVRTIFEGSVQPNPQALFCTLRRR